MGSRVEVQSETPRGVCLRRVITLYLSLSGTRATLSTRTYQIKDGNDIPTGQLGSFPGIDSNEEFVLGPHEPTFDHCFIMNTGRLPTFISFVRHDDHFLRHTWVMY